MLAPSHDPETPWQTELLNSLTSTQDLVENGLITIEEELALTPIADQFKIRITPYYSQLIANTPNCPIRLQAIPHLGEQDPLLPDWATQWSQKIYGRPTPWHSDPIGDIIHQGAPRLTHRYQHRAILHLSSLCALYCRFCFRKSHLNDDDRTLYEGSLDPAFQYLARNTEITEVILTGGDPLSLTDASLERVFTQLEQIAHIKVLRIHSRMAVTLPIRFTAKLVRLLGQDRRFQIHLVSHFNHPKELTDLAKKTLKQLKKAGVSLLNQSVLMKGVNSSVEVLASLFQALYEQGVIPYYLHHPDWTPGTFQFRLPIQEGQRLMQALRGRLSGPALPDYILEIPQGQGKISLLDSRVIRQEGFHADGLIGGVYQVMSPQTRAQSDRPYLYLDLAHMSTHTSASDE
jgi:lysine 2,3-aminomutase